MTSRLYFFGRTPDLSRAELAVFIPDQEVVTPDVVRVSSPIEVDGKTLSDHEFIQILGGTVKIAEEVGMVTDLTATALIQYMKSDEKQSRITFGLSGYGVGIGTIKTLVSEMKDLFESSHIPARFVLPREGNVISAVAVEKEQLVELVIVKKDESYVIGRTIAIQPFESWGKRDYERPYADAKLGMLPPKVARMIVNIGLGQDSRGKTLLDPFCGMGTILGEALLRGVNTVGGDINAEVVQKAKKNISWLVTTFKLLTTARISVSDATHVDETVDHESIDAIVTEPFLGTPKIGEGKITDPKEIKQITKGLEKLYIGSLKNWQSVLKSKGIVVMAIPSFAINNIVYSVKKVVDSCEILGYTKVLGPIVYSRPQAIVQRNFYIFQKN